MNTLQDSRAGRRVGFAAAAVLLLALMAGAATAQDGLVLEGAAAPDATAETGAPGEDTSLIIGEDESLWRLFTKGGIVMPVILVASVVALAFAVERGVALRSTVQLPGGLRDETVLRLSRGGEGPASALLKEREGTLARTLLAALGRSGDGRSGMEEAAAAEAYRALYELRRNTRPIGIVASVAPLLGLLGTVFGMIKAFDRVSGGGLGRSQDLARGIAEALLTTGAGLVVAIPALVVYHYFRARTEDIVRRSETEAASFIDRVVSMDTAGASAPESGGDTKKGS